MKKIKLVRSAMNPDFAIVGKMVIKLSYAGHEKTDPVLEVFENTKWAQEKEWTCFGPSFDDNDEWAGTYVFFNKLDEAQQVQIGYKTYFIKFINSGKEKYKYPDSIEDVPYYEFFVTELNE